MFCCFDKRMPRKKKFDVKKEIRKLARERVGTVPPGKTIVPKQLRAPKHKKPIGDENTL
jgi:hypothetical protein